MAKTIRVRDFMHSVLTTLQDTSPAYTRWSEVELIRYTNLGQRAIAAYVPHAGSRVDAIQLTPGTRQDLTTVAAARVKPSDGSTPAANTYGISVMNLVRGMGSDGLTPGKVIRKVDLYTLDTVDEDWHTRTGIPRKFMSDGKSPKTFYVSPGVPATPAFWAEVQWIAEPDRVPDGGAPGAEVYLVGGTSTQLLGIHDDFEEDLRNYVIGMALMKGSKNEQNTQKASLHIAAFTNSINAKATVIGGVNPALQALPYMDAGASQPGA